MNLKLDQSYWENRYQEKSDRWDLGAISPPIKYIIDNLKDTSIRILIPGGGNSWEAEYMHRKGFANVFVVDIAPSPLENLQKRVPNFPKEHIIQSDFFKLDTQFDLIIEQTFFCALNPDLRNDYVKKAHELLSKKGKLVGLLFCAPLNNDKPPFGGDANEYNNLFTPLFTIQKMKKTQLSIESRLGRELIFEMEKK